MKDIDKEFEEYLRYSCIASIKSLYSLSEEIPLEIDNNIIETLIKATKSSTDEFIEDAKKIHISNKDIKECKEISKKVINRFEQEINNKKDDNILVKFLKSITGVSLFKDMTNNKYDCMRRKLRDAYINNLEIDDFPKISDEIITKWIEYYEYWMNVSNEEYNNKRVALKYNEDGIVTSMQQDNNLDKIQENSKDDNNLDEIIAEKRLFLVVIYSRNTGKTLNKEILRKIIKFELTDIEIRKF